MFIVMSRPSLQKQVSNFTHKNSFIGSGPWKETHLIQSFEENILDDV
jgi:hypothetical protein